MCLLSLFLGGFRAGFEAIAVVAGLEDVAAVCQTIKVCHAGKSLGSCSLGWRALVSGAIVLWRWRHIGARKAGPAAHHTEVFACPGSLVCTTEVASRDVKRLPKRADLSKHNVIFDATWGISMVHLW